MNEDPARDVPATPEDQPADARTVKLLRLGGIVEQAPPPQVWASIVRALGGSGGTLRVVGGPGSPDLTAGRRTRASGRGGATLAWRQHGPRLLAAAAVGALLTWTGFTLTDRDQTGEVLASGRLLPLAGERSEGSAEVVEVDGHQRLRVQLGTAPDAGDGYLEVWLLRPDVSGMVTLGVLDGQDGEFLLPDGIDLAEYAVVDISREHIDGNPGHGGNSLVRGEFG